MLTMNILRVSNINRICCRLQHTFTKCTPNDEDPVSKVRPVFTYARENADRCAVVDSHGEYTYRSLFNSSLKLSKEISRQLGEKRNERVAFLCPNDASYVITLWASWIAGQIVVPLSKLHPSNLLEYYLNDSNAGLVVTTQGLSESISSLSVQAKSKLLILDDNLLQEAATPKPKKSEEPADESVPMPPSVVEAKPLEVDWDPEFYETSDALILYTSGTTGPPKGVVITHRNVHSQVQSMIAAWGWTQNDVILHALPLHHVHGITNALLTPLSIGAKVVMLPEWNTSEVWSRLLAIKKSPSERVSVFMGVPTMYAKLINEYDSLFAPKPKQVEFIRAVLSQKVRLMISGSAPLTENILSKWQEISGHVLLERYGMSETGMVLSNPLKGERKPGSVGQPMPGVRVRVVSREDPKKVLVSSDTKGKSTTSPCESSKTVSGDLHVKGPTVFRCYWNKPKATASEFTDDGWFKTGDVAEYSGNYYRLLGRSSVDIIKTGGFKVSALDVETALLSHEDIEDVAVVGVADPTWGEKVTAIVVLAKDKTLELPTLREWAKQKMAPYAVPTELKVVEAIPRNQMGKVNKKDLIKTLFTVKQ